MWQIARWVYCWWWIPFYSVSSISECFNRTILLLHGADQNRICHCLRAWFHGATFHHRALDSTAWSPCWPLALVRDWHRLCWDVDGDETFWCKFFGLYDISRHGGFWLCNFKFACSTIPRRHSISFNPVHTTNLHLFARLCLSLCLSDTDAAGIAEWCWAFPTDGCFWRYGCYVSGNCLPHGWSQLSLPFWIFWHSYFLHAWMAVFFWGAFWRPFPRHNLHYTCWLNNHLSRTADQTGRCDCG